MSSEKELERFRSRLWKSRGRRGRSMGTILLVMSAIFLVFAYMTRYTVFEIVSIIALFLGVLLIFTGIENYMKEIVGNQALVSPLIALNEVVESHYGFYEGNAVFCPSIDNVPARTFLPRKANSPLPTRDNLMENTILLPNQGILLPSTGAGLLELYEEEIGDLQNMDYKYFLTWLPRVLVEGLKICEKADINVQNEEVRIELLGSVFRYLCQQEKTRIACRKIGCPLTSSIASGFAKNLGRAVRYQSCTAEPRRRKTVIHLELGPTFEKGNNPNSVTSVS